MTDKVEARTKMFSKYWAEGDCAAVGKLYTEDCVVMPPGHVTVKGREGTQQYFKELATFGVSAFDLVVETVYVAGDYVVSRGQYTTKKGAEVVETGKYMTIWTEVSGELCMVNDIWNTNQ